jgi:hypothetical protein
MKSTWRLAAAMALAWAAPAVAADQIGYAAPDGVNTIPVAKAAPLPVHGLGIDTATGQGCEFGSTPTCAAPPVLSTYDAPFSGFIDMPTDGATYTAGRSFEGECTGPGKVKVTASDGSTRTLNFAVGDNIRPYAVTAWTLSGVSGAATCTYANLK